MKSDVQLVVVDIPGINEAGSSRKYKRYVEENWGTFDCVLVVMDAVQGVNTQEQVDLLKFVHQNNQEQKEIATIILGNKVDDPEHQSKQELVQEAREKAIEIFGSTCSKKHLSKFKKATASNRLRGPVFVPISAAYAFLYRKAGKMTIDSLQKLDKEILDGIGEQEVVPKKWAKLSHARKCEIVHASINNPTEYNESLERTNFDTLVAVLRHFIGGKAAQNEIIARQVTYTLENLSVDDKVSLSESIHSAYRKSQAIERSTDDLMAHFWRVYDVGETEALKMMKDDVDPSALAICFSELEKHNCLSGSLGWKNQQKRSLKKMKELLGKQLAYVIEKKDSWSFVTFYKETATIQKAYCGGNYSSCRTHGSGSCGRTFTHYTDGISVNMKCGGEVFSGWKKPEKANWTNFSPEDWIVLSSSLLLPSNEMEFYKSFGIEKTTLDTQVYSFKNSYNRNGKQILSALEQQYLEANEKRYLQSIRKKSLAKEAKEALIKIQMPASIEDQKHWGHLGYKYVRFHRSLNAKK